MSTKSSLAWGKKFSLYQDMMSETSDVYLRVDGSYFEVSPGSVTIRIPASIWETIRQHPALKFEFADWSDDDILNFVIKEVDERIAKWSEAADERIKAFHSAAGSGVYGPASDPRDEQIKEGVADLEKIRAYERSVRAEQETHETYESYRKKLESV